MSFWEFCSRRGQFLQFFGKIDVFWDFKFLKNRWLEGQSDFDLEVILSSFWRSCLEFWPKLWQSSFWTFSFWPESGQVWPVTGQELPRCHILSTHLTLKKTFCTAWRVLRFLGVKNRKSGFVFLDFPVAEKTSKMMKNEVF